MFDSHGYPAAEVKFDKDAHVVGDEKAVMALATRSDVTDLVIISHGWNNDLDQAAKLYGKLAASLAQIAAGQQLPGLAGRTIALAGVYWPSKKFTDPDLISGGAASAGSAITVQELTTAIDELARVLPDLDATKAKSLLPLLDDKSTARAEFARTLVAALHTTDTEAEDSPSAVLSSDPGELLDRLNAPIDIPRGPNAQGGVMAISEHDASARQGSAAGMGTPAGWLGAANNLLNTVTYYAMKERAGEIGQNGLAPLIQRIRQERPDLRIHLVGHSFGGRLVTATANALPSGSVASMSLLQAAFSHNGLSEDWRQGQPGHFRAVLSNHVVSGPILITHTLNDKAVGIAYALASRAAGQNASGLGDAGDIYGGMGRNGAQHTAEASFGELLATTGTYHWNPAPKNVHNLKADKYIADHSDIAEPQVAYAILSAIAAT